MMAVLQPADIGTDAGLPHLDAAVAAVDMGGDIGGRLGIVEEGADVFK